MPESPVHKDAFELERANAQTRFDTLEAHILRVEQLLLDSFDHHHRDKVSWVALMPILAALVAAAVGLS